MEPTGTHDERERHVMTDTLDQNCDFIMLIGAGASSDIGYLSLSDFVPGLDSNNPLHQMISRIYADICIQKFHQTAPFEELIVKLKYYKRLANSIKTDVILGDVYGFNNGVKNSSAEALFGSVLDECYSIMAKSYGPNTIDRKKKEFQFLPNFYEKIARAKNNKLHIYTTNYDCAYQVLASNYDNITFMTHISNKEKRGQFRDNWYHIRSDLEKKALPQVFIHRLHGCVAWFDKPDLNGGIGHTAEIYGAGGTDEIYVPPDDLRHMCIKLIDHQFLGTNHVFSSAFEEFNNQLKIIDILLVWGYSFRDIEVTRQINQALIAREKKPFRIYYIDPYLTEYAALENIHNTLKTVPVQISDSFEPHKIDWTPTDGRDKLVEKVLTLVESGD